MVDNECITNRLGIVTYNSFNFPLGNSIVLLHCMNVKPKFQDCERDNTEATTITFLRQLLTTINVRRYIYAMSWLENLHFTRYVSYLYATWITIDLQHCPSSVLISMHVVN